VSKGYLKTMLEFLTGAYTRKDIRNAGKGIVPVTNIGKLFSLAADNFEIIHENAERVLLWDNLDNAKGVVLDRYGLNFGVARQGVDDDFYRLIIKVKVIALLSGGDIDTVINAAASLFDVAPDKIDLREFFPAKIQIGVDDTVLDDYRRKITPLIVKTMKRIVAAGVGLEFVQRLIFDGRGVFYTGVKVAYLKVKIMVEVKMYGMG